MTCKGGGSLSTLGLIAAALSATPVNDVIDLLMIPESTDLGLG